MAQRRPAVGVVLSALIAASACNLLLDNDARRLEHVDREAGGIGGSAGGEAEPSGVIDGVGTPGSGDAGAGSDTGGGGDTEAGGHGGGAGESGAAGARPETTTGDPSTSASGSGGSGSVGSTNCVDAPECEPGTIGPDDTRACACKQGIQRRSKTCSEACTWVHDAWSPCSVTPECEPGTKGAEETVACPCGSGGTKTRVRTCTDACVWGEPTDTSSCPDDSLDCCTELKWCYAAGNDPAAPPDRGTWCWQLAGGAACTRDEVYRDCVVEVYGQGCTLHEVVYVEYL